MGDIIKGKLNGKHVMAVALSTILLLSVTQFSIAQNENGSTVQEDKTRKGKGNEAKFESDFIEKVKKMHHEEIEKKQKEGDSYKAKEYGVYIFVEEPDELEENIDNFTSIEEVKDKLEKDLLQNHKASLAQKAEELSYVAARLPVTELLKLSEYYYVDLIGDGEREGEPLSLQDGDFGLVKKQADKLLPVETNMDVARSTINANGLSSTLCNGVPCDGRGVYITVIDIGIRQNPEHPDLPIGNDTNDKIIFQTNCESVVVCVNNGDYCCSNHGTANAGIAASSGNQNPTYKGIAPAAKILNAVVNTGGSGTIAAIDWAAKKATSGYKPMVITISNNPGNCNFSKSQSAYERAVDQAVEKGIVIVAAVGNSGGDYVTLNACAFNVIAVGGIDDKGTTSKTDDEIMDVPGVGHSSFGPTFDGRAKPDILAPAVNIKTANMCTINGSDYNDQVFFYGSPPTCQSTPTSNVTGTSHAAPMVAGAAALLLQKNPNWTPAQVKAALKDAADASLSSFPNIQDPSITDPAMRGAGVLNVAGALSLTSPLVGQWGYGIDLSTYVVKSTVGRSTTKVPTVEYKLFKEVSGFSVIDGKLRQGGSTSSPQYDIFSKLVVPSIKIDGVTKTLTDSNMVAGPRVEHREDIAKTYVTYKDPSDGKRIQLFYNIKNSIATGKVKYLGSSDTKTYDTVFYFDYNVIDTDDRARPTASGTPYSNEIKLTSSTSSFFIRDNTSNCQSVLCFPYLEYRQGKCPTKWILKPHALTDNPEQYLNSEAINPANIVVDCKASGNGLAGGKTLTHGPTVNVKWDPAIGGVGVEALPGQLVIIKDAIPDDPQDFNFTGTLESFTLDDDDDLATPSPLSDRTEFEMTPGTYTVIENVPAGWYITEIDCDITGNVDWSVQGSTLTITFTTNANDSATCIFENLQ